MRLLRVEIRRLVARKTTWLALVGSILIACAALFGVHQQANEIDRARSGSDTFLQQEVQNWEENGEQWIAECEQDEAFDRESSGDASIDYGCDEMGPPTAEDFYGQMPSLGEQYRELLGFLVYPFLLLALGVGSTHVAAEFSHRTMGAWLTFVPRRTPVYATKVSSAALVALPVVGVGMVLVLLGVPALFRWHGIDDGVTQAQWTGVAWQAVRILALGAAAAAFGAAAAFLLRHSGAVIGLMLGYVAVVEGILGSMLPSMSRYLLGRNITAFSEHGTEWSTFVDCADFEGCREIVLRLSFAQATITLGLVMAVVAGLALWRFVRADID